MASSILRTSLKIVCVLWLSQARMAQAQLSCESAVEEAIRNGPASLAAKGAYNAALAAVEQDRPIVRPTVSAVAAGTIQGPGVTLPLPGAVTRTVLPEQAGRLDLILQMPVFRAAGGAARQRFEALKQQALLDYRKSLLDIRASVYRLFSDLVRAESGIRTAEAGLEAARRFAELTEALVKTGSGKPADRDQAAAQLADAEAGVKKAKMGRLLAVMAINQALGKATTANTAYALPSSFTALPVSPDAGIAAAKTHRIELLELRVSLMAAKAGLSLAKSQSALSLNAKGQLTEQTPTALLHEHFAAATLELQIPLFDGGKTRNDVAEAQARIKQLQALLQQAESGIELDVRRAYLEWKQAIEDVAAARASVLAAESALRVAEKAFEVGRISAAEVFAARREAQAAREKEATAQSELISHSLDYSAVQGDAPNIVNTIANIPVKLTVTNYN
jgi:outer membrane protein